MWGYLIYLDHAATTPIDPSVISVMDNISKNYFANPSSIHSLGQKSKVLIENSRKTVASSIGAQAGEVVFTSGGTESNNFALIGTARAHKNSGNHLITSKIEHPANLETCQHLSENGFRITYLDVDENGLLDFDQLEKSVCDDTILISLMMANNETGGMLPIREVGKFIGDKKIIFHSDAVQAFGKTDIDVNDLNIDLLSLSSHKIYGPKGCGSLYIRQGTDIENILFGGSQEISRRPGTENIGAIAGFAEAVRQIENNLDSLESIRNLCVFFEKKLKETFPNLKINGDNVSRVPGISNIYFPFMSGDSLLMNLDLHKIAASTGSACSSGSQKPSHVLKAMGYDDKRINNSLRFSLGRDTTEKEILHTIDVLKSIYDNNNL
jgi:cysteine desulfurase